MTDLVLDPQIRNWVLLPIISVILMMTLVRTYAQQLLKGTKKQEVEDIKLKSDLQRAARLRTNGGFIGKRSFYIRKLFFVGDEHSGVKGILRRKVKGAAAANPMMNGGMMDGLKNQMSFMFSNMAMIGLISYFFEGFVLVKIPFPLTMRFKTMLQRGIQLATLDASYVSTLSWYFVVMFGLRGVMSLIMGDNSAIMDEARMMQAQMGMAGGAPGGAPPDFKKLFSAEADSLVVAQHKSMLDESEKSLVDSYRARA